jgi:hypothetical protein
MMAKQGVAAVLSAKGLKTLCWLTINALYA